ncbi:MAG: BTB/POZ domain-containing protein [Parachlamydiaceae bacterium]|nr:BTB/POZ domain-containing protein [Parachlamydiaceae bacterium]
MQLPALLPSEFSSYSQIEDDQQLFDQLVQQPNTLILFFEYACDDETWSDTHSIFMRAALEWMTEEAFQDRLWNDSIQFIAQILQHHYSALRSVIPLDISVEASGNRIAVNSLLFIASSEVFHDLLRAERDKNQTTVILKKMPPMFLPLLIECVTTGNVAEAWKLGRQELFELLQHATDLQFLHLMEACQETLKRYVNKDTAVETLILAHKKSWNILKQVSCAIINEARWGAKIESVLELSESVKSKGVTPLAFEFVEFRDVTLDLFTKLQFWVTHLICGGTLAERPEFRIVVRNCPQLISLDISHSQLSREALQDVPSTILELDVSQSPWLTDAILKTLIAKCTGIKKLNLSGNMQLTYAAWGELQNLPQLIALDISRCRQIHDEEFSLIVKAVPQLMQLSLAECKHLTNKAFFELAHSLSQLMVLNAARCHLSDGLLLEIVTRCRQLQYLDLTRCPEISEKGLLSFVRQASQLQTLIITRCRVSPTFMEQLQKMRPRLNVIF